MEIAASSVMDLLRFGLVGLPDPERALIATIFRLNRFDPSFIWALSEQAPYDAVLVDSRTRNEWRGSRTARVCYLMAVGEAARTSDELARPLRSDHLMAWLNSVEVQILHGGHDGFASTARSQASASEYSHSTGLRHSLAQHVLSEQPEKQIDRALAQTLADQRFKLKRWPPQDVLAANVIRIRAATMLSRRAMSTRELGLAARMPAHQCEAFVRTLVERALVVQVEEVPDKDRPTSVSPAAPTPKAIQARRGLGRTLIASMRRRFGWGNSQ